MKQRAKVLIALSAFFVLSAFSLMPVSARPIPLSNLPGARINVATGAGTTFYAYEKTKIFHGYNSQGLYGGKGWSEFSPEEKKEFLKTVDFSLYIREEGETDWQNIKLNPFIWYNGTEDVMNFLRFKVFLANTFDLGTYEFRGVWYIEEYGVPSSWENIVTVTVLS